MDSVVLEHPLSMEPAVRCDGKSRVCRALFGPIDHKLTKQFLRHEWSEILVKSSREWDFDFSRDIPVRNGEKFSWERVESAKPEALRRRRTSPKTCRTRKLEGRKQAKCLSLLQSSIKDYMPVEKRPLSSKTKRKAARRETRKTLPRKPRPKCRFYPGKVRRK